MRLSLLGSLSIAAVLGIMALDASDANALVRRSTTVVTTPGGPGMITRRSSRVGFARTWRGARGAVGWRRWRGARGAVIVHPGIRRCRTVFVNGVRVRRCF